MSNIILNESQIDLWQDNYKKAQRKEINDNKAELENYIERSGEYMIDITNNKTYMVQYLKALSELVGRDYAMCAPVREDGTYGAFYVKPWNTFMKKDNVYGQQKNMKPMKLQGNLYQKLNREKKR